MVDSKKLRRSDRSKRSVPSSAYAAEDDAANDSDFSPDDQPDTKKGKRTAKADKPTLPKKKQRPQSKTPAANSVQPPVTPQPKHTLGPTRVTPSSSTKHLNRWMAIRDKLEVVGVTAPTKIEFHELKPLHLHEDIPGRDFQFEVEAEDLEINWDPTENDTPQWGRMNLREQQDKITQYTKIIKTWRIRVFNSAAPEDDRKRLRLFPEIQPAFTKLGNLWHGGLVRQPSHNGIYFIRGGPLDAKICPTEPEAAKVAAEACKLLNKFPGPINDEDFPEEVSLNDRKVSSGMIARKLIELLSLRAYKANFDFDDIRYVFRYATKNDPGQYFLNTSPGLGYRKDHDYCSLPLPAFGLEGNKSGDGEAPTVRFNTNILTQELIDKLPPVPSSWKFRVIPRTGDKVHGGVSVESVMKFVEYLVWQTFGTVGTYEAFILAPGTLATGSTLVRNSGRAQEDNGPFGGKAMLHSNRMGEIILSRAVKDAIRGGIPPTIISDVRLSSTATALAMQSAYVVFRDTSNILEAIEELYVSVEELVAGKSILSVHSYCTHESEDEKKNYAHHCHYCRSLFPCMLLQKDQYGRMICTVHFKEGAVPADDFLRRQTKIMRCARSIERNRLTMEHRTDMLEILCQRLTIKGYQDDFDGDRLDTQGRAPCRMNVDATFPLFESSSAFYVHHPDNVGLTAEYLNSAKADDIPIVLALASDAVTSADAGRDVSETKRLELGFDHCYHIRIAIPWSKDQRIALASEQEITWWPALSKAMRSGVYTDAVKRIYDWEPRPDCKKRSTWDAKTVARLDKVCQEIENSPVYNPGQKLKLPRGPPVSAKVKGAPWLFNEAHQFDDHNWDLLGCMFNTRFFTLDNRCDLANDHENESGETIFLMCVILWFKSGGGYDDILRVRMTVFVRHSLRFSIGRDLHVDPGSIMHTGWTVKHPKSLSEYDDTRRTIVMETWLINRAKRAHAVTPESISLFRQLLREVPSASKHWDTYPPIYPLDELPFPRNCRKWSKAAVAEKVDNEDLSDDERDDESVASYAESDNFVDLLPLESGDAGDDDNVRTEAGDEEGGSDAGAGDTDKVGYGDGKAAGSFRGVEGDGKEQRLNGMVSYLLGLAGDVRQDQREKYMQTVRELGVMAGTSNDKGDGSGSTALFPPDL